MSSWSTTVEGIRYSIFVRDGRVHLDKDTGTKETSGFNEIPIPRLLRSRRLQARIAAIHGGPVLAELLAACAVA